MLCAWLVHWCVARWQARIHQGAGIRREDLLLEKVTALEVALRAEKAQREAERTSLWQALDSLQRQTKDASLADH